MPFRVIHFRIYSWLQKSELVSTDGFGYQEPHSAVVTPSMHPSGRNPDSAPRPMYPLFSRQSIYAPTVLARQPSVSSSITSSAFGFSFSAIERQ